MEPEEVTQATEQAQEPSNVEVQDALLIDAPEQPQQEEQNWLDSAMQDPEFREQVRRQVLNQNTQQVPQQPPPKSQIEVLGEEIDAMQARYDEILDLQNPSEEDRSEFLRIQRELNSKVRQEARLRSQETQQMLRQEQEVRSASSTVNKFMDGFAQQDPNFNNEAKAGFLRYLDQNNIPANVRNNPTVLNFVAKTYMYDQGRSRGANKPKDVQVGAGSASSFNQANPKPVDASNSQVTDEHVTFARSLGMDPQDFANLTEQGKYTKDGQERDLEIIKPNMTSSERRRMRP